MTDGLKAVSEMLPLWRRSHEEYIVYCERASKILMLGGSELDVREFEMSAARLEGTMVELQATVRRVWESRRQMAEGLQSVEGA